MSKFEIWIISKNGVHYIIWIIFRSKSDCIIALVHRKVKSFWNVGLRTRMIERKTNSIDLVGRPYKLFQNTLSKGLFFIYRIRFFDSVIDMVAELSDNFNSSWHACMPRGGMGRPIPPLLKWPIPPRVGQFEF